MTVVLIVGVLLCVLGCIGAAIFFGGASLRHYDERSAPEALTFTRR
jgi:hypothetical protein